MKSQYGDFFNHDNQAGRYDANVLNENDPIRAGYQAVLDWVSEQCRLTPDAVVLDLGCGTGNLSLRLQPAGQLVCVDISEKMLAQARQKLAHLDNVSFIQADLLIYFAGAAPNALRFDAIASTYTIHHLTEAEKPHLFERIYHALVPGGRAVFGDLMFADEAGREALIQHYQAQGNFGLVEDIHEEFFWLVDRAEAALSQLGFSIDIRRFSELSWAIAAQKGEAPC